MAAQSLTSRRATSSPSSSSARSDGATKAKRARTKHACDECRRSQKKCDGERPLCRRCYLNGTQCTYTPHKSRSHCACTGQSAEEVHRDRPEADVYIFPIDPRSSFHTWSTHSSPDHSPTNSGLDTPSPTLYTQEELETSYNAAYADAGNASHGSGHGNPQTIVNPQHHQFQPAIACHHQIYSQRSLSLPNVSAQPSPSNRSAVVTPQSIPASLPQYPLPSAQMHDSFDHVFGTNTNHQYSPPPPSPYDAINMQQQQLSAHDTNTLFDIPSQYQQTLSEVDINQQLSALYATAPTSDSPPPMHVYTQGTHASNQATQQQQLPSPLDTFNAASLEATSGYTSNSGLVFPASLLEHASAQVQQGHYLERAPYGGGPHLREQQPSGAYASTSSDASPLSWGSPTSSGSSTLPQGQPRPSPSPSNYGGFEYYEWSQH